MLDILRELGIIANVEPGGNALAGNNSAFASPSFGCNCLISFILLKARINGGLFSVPAPPTYASERRGFLLGFGEPESTRLPRILS
jgi:hypothetical protein